MIYCIKFERNEYAKRIRKAYEGGADCGTKK